MDGDEARDVANDEATIASAKLLSVMNEMTLRTGDVLRNCAVIDKGVVVELRGSANGATLIDSSRAGWLSLSDETICPYCPSWSDNAFLELAALAGILGIDVED